MTNRLWDKEHKLVREMLRDMRKQKGWTQVQLSEALGKPQSYVAKYENGERRIDFVEVAGICSALDSNVANFSQLYLNLIDLQG